MKSQRQTMRKRKFTRGSTKSVAERHVHRTRPSDGADEKIRLQGQLLDAIPQAIVATDLTGRVVFWNRFAETLYGRTAAEALHRNVADLAIAPAALVEASNLIARLRHDEHWSGEFPVQRPDGTTFTAQLTASPILDEQGNSIGVVSLSTDVTAHARAADTFERTYSILNAVSESTTDGIFVKDLAGRYLLINAAGASFFGVRPADVIGKEGAEIVASDNARRYRANDLRVIESGQAQTFEEVLTLGGSTRTFQSVKAPYRDSRGQLIGTIGITRDITEQKQAREANRFLVEAGARLARSVDFETRLTTIAQLAVPHIADWCAVHSVEADGSIPQWALALVDPSQEQKARAWLQRCVADADWCGLAGALRRGEPKLVPDVFAELAALRPDEAADRIGWADDVTSYMIVPLRARGRTLGAITFMSAESGRRFDAHALALAENLANQAATYLDNAHLYRESQRLNAELERRVEERTAELIEVISEWKQSEQIIQTLFRLSKQLNAMLDLDTLMDELAQDAIQLVNAESGFAGLRTAGGMMTRKYFQGGVASPFEHTWPPGQGLPGWVLAHKVPYITNDAARDPVIRHELPINADLRSVICMPILDNEGEAIGFFDIRNKTNGSGFNLADQEVLTALSSVAAIAIQNALSYQQLAWAEVERKHSNEQLRALAANLQSVREEERTQIARELHDELGQALTALKFDLAWLTSRLAKKDAALSQKASAVTTQIDTTIKTVRRISTELRPGMLDDLGLAAAIEWQAREFQKRTGVHCEVRVPTQDLQLTRAQSTGLFRIFQETLTNVARHANAQRVVTTLAHEADALTLSVQDNGRGIQPSERAGARSLGLLGMRERTELLGGAFDIRGAPGEGTTVRVRIPLTPTTPAP